MFSRVAFAGRRPSAALLGQVATREPYVVDHVVMHRTATANVLAIGTGAAGWRAAIAATQAGVQPRMLAKRASSDAHTVLASGGINAALGTRNSDTARGGSGSRGRTTPH
jgi:FAD binding domain-containing protein